MKKAYTGELMSIKRFDERFRIRFGISFCKLSSRLDTFPVYAIKDDGSNVTVYPGYKVFNKYNMYFLFMGADYGVFKLGNLTCYPGLDFIVGGVDMDYDLSYNALRGDSFSGGEILGGVRLRIGADYSISEKTGVFIEANRSWYKIAEQGFFSNNDIGIGFRYNF